MFSYDVKFITCDDSINLKSGDFKSFKYDTKKRADETLYDSAKRSYCERRGGHWRMPRPRQLKQLESKLRDRSVVACDWTNESTITLAFSSGTIAYLSVLPRTLDITQVLFDRYCVGKLMGQVVSNVVLSKTHLLFIHPDRIATLITFGKSVDNAPLRISEKDPHIQSLELGGGGRRTERRVTWCETPTGIKVLVWSATTVEPAPWSPIPQDHANLHLYEINGQQASLIAYHQLENDVLSAELSDEPDNIVHIVQQTTCQKNAVTLEWLQYESTADRTRSLRACGRAVASLPAPARAARRNPAGRLLVACIDGSIHVLHCQAGLTNSARAGFIPTDVRWAGELVVAAEEAGRLQCFDRALSPLHHHARCIDLASYLRESKRIQILATRSMPGGPLLLATFSGGPLTLLKITHPRLLSAWLRAGRTSTAVTLLRAMDWASEGAACLRAVGAILRARTDHTHAQAALGTYLAPAAPLPPAAAKYGPALYDLARKFFYQLLRRGHIEKALSLALDVRAWDLYADARWAAARAGLPRLASEAAEYARLAHAETAGRADSECSESCSQCSSHSGSEDDVTEVKTNPPPLPRVPLHPTIPVPIAHTDSHSTSSIRPNLHQYVDRDNTIWATNVRDDTFISAKDYEHFNPAPNTRWSSMDNVLMNLKKPDAFKLPIVDTRPEDRGAHFKHLYQTELRDETPDTYRFQGNSLLLNAANFNGRYRHDNFYPRSRPPEKNKVKFSDTVTIAVMSEPASPEAASEPRRAFPPGTPLDYVEV